MGKIDALFLTHFHSDHTPPGSRPCRLTGWLAPPFGQRRDPFPCHRFRRAQSLMENLQKAYALDIKIRLRTKSFRPRASPSMSKELRQGEGVVYREERREGGGLRGPSPGDAIKPSVGYRIEYKGHAVVLYGDAGYDDVVKHAAGADLLIHEVGAAWPGPDGGSCGPAHHPPISTRRRRRRAWCSQWRSRSSPYSARIVLPRAMHRFRSRPSTTWSRKRDDLWRPARSGRGSHVVRDRRHSDGPAL